MLQLILQRCQLLNDRLPLFALLLVGDIVHGPVNVVNCARL